MIDSLRLFGLLLHKCWLIRKRQWITSLVCEIVIPIIFIYCGCSVYLRSWQIQLDTGNYKHYESLSFEQLIDQNIDNNKMLKIIYAPSNPFTDELMIKFEQCVKNIANVTKFKTESELVANFIKTDMTFWTWTKSIAVIFDKYTDASTNHLRYKLRPQYVFVESSYNSLLRLNMTNNYLNTYFVQTQICLDESYVKMKVNNATNETSQVFIQRVPHPMANRSIAYTNGASICFILVGFAIPLFIEALIATKEKFVGINILMSMNGIPNALNLLSWIISGVILLSTFCVIAVLLLIAQPTSYSKRFLTYGNPFILLVVFICHLGHSLTFGIHVSAYFSKCLHLTYALIFISALSVILRCFVLELTKLHLVPYVGMILPMVMLYQALSEICAYETIGIGTQWDNLFMNANPEIELGGTLGMILILSIIGMIIHFVFAIYIYTINPGKSGIGKHPLFLLMWKRKAKHDNNVENLIFDDLKDKYFEPTTSGRVCMPGIQIRNLKKAYDISIFNREKVHALRGISVDFYKGQITSLLGHNGAGKTTLMSILTGSICPSDGLILIDSKNLKDNASEILQDIGFYIQDNMYFPNLTVTEQLDFFAMIKRKKKSRSVIKGNVTNLIKKLKLYNVKDSLPNKLSKDQKRKLCLGMAFVADPSTLILDEPTSCMDHENKHLIWDILLEMRGRKTILVSTHDMEEADILGNRIAIMHEGRLKSYGTSLYLKKMIAGQSNIDVTLSVERWSEPERIRTELHKEARIVEKQDKKIIVSVPISSMLSGSLDNLERKKKEFGVSAYSLSHVGLEQVFLKVIEDNENDPNSHEIFTDVQERSKGRALYIQSIRALVAKKLNCALKDLKIIIKQILMIFIALLSVSLGFTLSDVIFGTEPEIIHVRLDMYDNPYTLYTSSDKAIGDQYKSISKAFGAQSLEISNITLYDGLLHRAQRNLVHYNNFVIAAAEFNKTANVLVANAFYSETATFSLPISINLLWNTIMKSLLGPKYSISIRVQSLPYIIIPSSLITSARMQGYTTTMLFVIPFYLAIAMFAVHPARESYKGIKWLQKMTGVSGFTYWATTFLIDFVHYASLVLLIIIGLVCMDQSLDLQLYKTKEIMIMILLLMLFGINVLPFIYIFSFIRMKTSNISKFLTFIPIAIVITECIMLILKYGYKVDNPILTTNHLLLPYTSFLYGQEIFQKTLVLNAFCRRLPDEFYEFQCKYFDGLCCEQDCHDKKCQKLLPYFFGNRQSFDRLEVSVTYLCATTVLYFGILALLESQSIQKMLAKCSRPAVLEPSVDKQVQREKIMVFEKIQKLNEKRKMKIQMECASDKQLFLAYELRKHYGKVKSVEDVSFMVKRGQCFGLFGINRSGKSMVFKMMTGIEIPDHGVMYIGDKDFENHNKYFLSQIGYCPQHDATLKCLNSYDHLRLFARLRGIPENHVKDEVDAWIERLNLSKCASQPSGTYSSGNKQRLNVAIALIGNPQLVLLDEPTTRMDPGARRSFWNTIKSCRIDDQTFMLASNNMEECETLCNRMAIILDGKLICIGILEELKDRFGAGYDVQIRLNAEKAKTEIWKIKKAMRLLLHCVLTNENSEFLLYRVSGAGTTWRKVYEVMNAIKKKYDCIDDFLVVVRLST